LSGYSSVPVPVDSIRKALWADSTGQRQPTVVVAFLGPLLAVNSQSSYRSGQWLPHPNLQERTSPAWLDNLDGRCL